MYCISGLTFSEDWYTGENYRINDTQNREFKTNQQITIVLGQIKQGQTKQNNFFNNICHILFLSVCTVSSS